MKEAKVFIWHDGKGKITAVGRPVGPHAGNVIPLAKNETHRVMMLDVPAHLVRSLHQTHKIDVRNRRLVAS